MDPDLICFILISFALGFFQTLMFYSCPYNVRAFFAGIPLLGVVTAWLLAELFLVFMGCGLLSYLANIIGAILFGFVILFFKWIKNIDKTTIEFDPNAKGIDQIIPIITVRYYND